MATDYNGTGEFRGASFTGPAPAGRLNVIMNEECEHRRYAVRDLAVLEADRA